MAIITPTDAQLTAATQDILSANSSLTAFGTGTAGAALTAALVEAKRTVLNLLQQADAARDIDLAQGTDLDNIARQYGMTRLPPTAAGTDSNAAQTLFTNTTSATLSVPSGTAVFASSDISTRFYTTTPLSLAPGASALTSVQGPTGIYQSIAQGALDAHNASTGLTVTNVLPIQGGGGYETDAELRYRISTTLLGAVVGGSTGPLAVQNALQAQPGVQQAILISPSPGTLNALIVTSSGYLADDDFLTSLQEVMASQCAAGISVTAIAPTVVGVDTIVALSVAGGASVSSLSTTITTVVESYINTLQIYVAPNPSLDVLSTVGSLADATLIYSDLLAAVTDVAQAALGTALQNVTLTLSAGNGTVAAQGNIYPRSTEVLRARSTQLTITAS
jgi:hypothetical protein